MVKSPAGAPLAEALVELERGKQVVASTRSLSNGSFSLLRVPADSYVVQVRRLGYGMHRRPLRVDHDIEHLDIVMPSYDSVARAEYTRKLAIARARARRWSCHASAQQLRAARADAFERFASHNVEAGKEYAMPQRRADFNRVFRLPTQRECVRLAKALDRQIGLLDEHVVAYRIGGVFWLPTIADGGGAIANAEGELLTVWVSAS